MWTKQRHGGTVQAEPMHDPASDEPVPAKKAPHACGGGSECSIAFWPTVNGRCLRCGHERMREASLPGGEVFGSADQREAVTLATASTAGMFEALRRRGYAWHNAMDPTLASAARALVEATESSNGTGAARAYELMVEALARQTKAGAAPTGHAWVERATAVAMDGAVQLAADVLRLCWEDGGGDPVRGVPEPLRTAILDARERISASKDGCSGCAAKIRSVRKSRSDAERPDRDQQEGIRTLRVWLRGIHMRMVGGWGQDTPQDEIAQLLGEHPSGHERAFTVATEFNEDGSPCDA